MWELACLRCRHLGPPERTGSKMTDRSHAPRGNTSWDAPRPAVAARLEYCAMVTQSVTGCIPTQSVGTIKSRSEAKANLAVEPGSSVGAGLLANAVCQSCMYQLIHRFREQARSHIWTVFFQVDRGEAIAAMRRPDKPAPTETQFRQKRQCLQRNRFPALDLPLICFYHSGRLSGRRALLLILLVTLI